jgi:protein-S-isoprenylcysteine O-methyltransferase Ste14
MGRNVRLFLLLVAPMLSMALALLGLETLDRNVFGWILIVMGVAYPAVTIAYYGIRKKLVWESIGEVLQEEQGDRSFWAIIPGLLVVFFASPMEFLYWAGEPERPTWIQITGLVLALLGIALGLWARVALRGKYSGHLQVTEGQSLVMMGPYRLVRHPSYAGLLLMSLGVASGYGSIVGLASIVLLVLPGLIYRMKVEEHILRKRFGSQYLDYQGRVRRLVPWLW